MNVVNHAEQKKFDVLTGGPIAIAASILYMVLVASVFTWSIGLLWGLINFLQTYGTVNATLPFPYFDPSPIPEQLFRNYKVGTFAGWVEDLINLNNSYFLGATRFGSGLGLVVGALLAVSTFPFKNPVQRLPVIVLAGIIIGARSMLMIASAPISAVVGGVVCGIVAVILGLVYVRDARIPRLPRIDFERESTQPTGSQTLSDSFARASAEGATIPTPNAMHQRAE